MTELTDFEQKLLRYADLAVRAGLNLQSGQRLRIAADVAAAALVRQVARRAYEAGAEFVDVIWSDDELDLIRLQHAPPDTLDSYPKWPLASGMEYAIRGDAALWIRATQPDIFESADPQLFARIRQARSRVLRPFQKEQMGGSMNWLGVVVPTASWAAKLFPDLAADAQLDRLWQVIFDILYLDEPDPVAVWRQHIDDLVARCEHLNDKRYKSLKMTGPGTNLRVGLAAGHVWGGGRMTSKSGIEFAPNLPTEEVFTLPHKDEVEGEIRGTKPLNVRGFLVEDFNLTFERGQVVSVSAAKGKALLQRMIETDGGAGHLGEVALVPHSSRISQTGLLFYDTLYDENAACHLALGDGYRMSLQDGDSISSEAFAAAGGNESMIHIDFMVGSDHLDVDGITEFGDREPLMRGGEWAFDV